MIWNILYLTYLGFTWIGQEVDQDDEEEEQLHHNTWQSKFESNDLGGEEHQMTNSEREAVVYIQPWEARGVCWRISNGE